MTYTVKRRLAAITHPVALAQRAWQPVSEHDSLLAASEAAEALLPTVQWQYAVFDGSQRVDE